MSKTIYKLKVSAFNKIEDLFRICFFIVLSLLVISSCEQETVIGIPMPQKTPYLTSELDLSDDVYYDKVLGAIVGSAIGDAMGASTEMWHRTDIQNAYGFITDLTTATREKSPEGTWRHNMIAGSTTDDTRWKYLMGHYINRHRQALSADSFTKFIESYYQSQLDNLSSVAVKKSTDQLDAQLEKVDWIKEWARVAIAYQEDQDAYDKAQARFYGGEMSCAGMLYSPVIGLVYSEAETAYEVAFDHAVFDIGYAKDISGLSAAMTSLAFHSVSVDSMIDVIRFVDPYDYKDSRLIGRLAESLALSAIGSVENAHKLDEVNPKLNPPAQFPGSTLEWTQLSSIYHTLESEKQAIAFHAGEIWQILIAGLAYGDGDFEKTMQFIVNYGRDNDTVAAVAGMILGAQIGFAGLPGELKEEVLVVSRDVIGIDLEELAGIVAPIGRHVEF